MEVALVLVAAVLIVAFLFFKKSGAKPAPTEEHQLPRETARQLHQEAARPREAAVPAQPAASQAAAVAVQPAAATPADRGEPSAAEALSVTEEPSAELEAEELDVQPAAPAAEPEPEFVREPVVDVAGMRRGLAKSRGSEGFFGRLKSLFTGAREIDASIVEEIEEVLLTSDVGVATTQAILARIKEQLASGELKDSSKVWDALRAEALRILQVEGQAGAIRVSKKPTVVLMVGVNGAGKTTTIGKLATKLKADGEHVVLAAGDTFRAAAVQQLQVWGDRVGCEVVAGKEGADPSAVLFDAVRKSVDEGANVLLADTAGRLHTKTNLMAEMTKISRSVGKALDGAPHETLLVIDATNGQNALAQAKEFKEALGVTGIVLTKLDGTAKGGVVLGICDSLKLPVRYVGLGERADDLHEFAPEAFVEALLGRDLEGAAA